MKQSTRILNDMLIEAIDNDDLINKIKIHMNRIFEMENYDNLQDFVIDARPILADIKHNRLTIPESTLNDEEESK
jgi:hypothetical protein